MEYQTVVERARERVDPATEERERLAAVAGRVVERAEEAVADLPVNAEVMQVGSTARGTWTSGDRDIDVFVRFPTDLDRETLERYGLQVGHAVLPEGHEEYAEHPYVKGPFEGFDVDLVPCYAVGAATDIRSAVDRTPFHNAYLAERLDDDRAADVRLAKGFLKGVGIYGSDLRTKGFSGYLVELLVCEYGGFDGLLEAVAGWQPPIRLDPEDHGVGTFDDPLVVIDPTDPERNVAAVVSTRNVARFIHHARAFRDHPSLAAFEQTTPEPLDVEGFRRHIERRGTCPVAIVFDAPELVDDQLYPQLERTLGGVRGALDRYGFDPLRGFTVAREGQALVFVECAVGRRANVDRHEGPPVYVPGHAMGFYETYADDDGVYGPFVEGDRYVVEREREHVTPDSLLASAALFEVGHGAHVESALHDGYDVLVDEECAALVERFGVDLAGFYDPQV